MAAGEDQPEPVVLDGLIVPPHRVTRFGVESLGENRLRCIEPVAPPHAVDGLETAGRNEPRSGISGRSIARPLLHRRDVGIVQRVLGEVEVAKQADQGGEDAPRLGPVDRIDDLAPPFSGVLAHWRRILDPEFTGRISEGRGLSP